MKRSLFEIKKMDCPSEEQMIRLALAKFNDLNFQFDLPSRRLTVIHSQDTDQLAKALEKLNLGSKLIKEEEQGIAFSKEKDEGNVLKILLLINFAMFIFEIGLGFYAQSAGLVADSFDMLADAIVYGMSIYAVGRSVAIQHRAARLSGWFQILLAVGAFSEVVRRIVFGSEPKSGMMMGVALVALVANTLCLLLLMKHREGAIHMRASWIFSTNDVLANIGVIVAGGLVYFFKNPIPDFVIGLMIAAVVARGALSILKMSSPQESTNE